MPPLSHERTGYQRIEPHLRAQASSTYVRDFRAAIRNT